MTKYYFGYSNEPAVECPALDEFIGDLVAVCEKYGAGFEVETDSGEGGYLRLVPYISADFLIFSSHLNEYTGGIPWLHAYPVKTHKR